MTQFGTIITGAAPEAGMVATLKLWLPSYISEVERQTGRTAGTVARPRSYRTAVEPDNWPEDQLPAVIVLAGGLEAEPSREGPRSYRTWFDLRVATIVSASTEVAARSVAQLYAAAIRSAALQHPSLGSKVDALDWQGETYEAAGQDRNRTIAASVVEFRAMIASVTEGWAGPQGAPQVDPVAPYPEQPTVLTTPVTVTKLAI